MNESLRLLTVNLFADYNLQLDAELQQLILMASQICETPVALITLLDEDNQWLKVRLGTDVEVMPRDLSFCQHAILQDEVMIVPDMLHDNRFVDNPLVTNEPHIRFYAGAPLIAHNGERLGTLCVTDVKPHRLNSHQQEMLLMLSKQAISLMELKHTHNLLEKNAVELVTEKETNRMAEIRLKSFFENSVNFHVLLGINGEILDYNKTAANFIRKIFNTDIERGMLLLDFVATDFRSIFCGMLTWP